MQNSSNKSIDWKAPHELVDVGASQLAYWRTGSGPDLLFVHGWPLCSATYRDLVPALAEDFTCHLFDLPGAGRSQWSDAAEIDIVAHVHTLGAAVGQVGLQDFAVLAHDSGGFIARHLAARLGERVWGLVLSGTEIPDHHSPLLKMFQVLLSAPGGASLFRLMLSFGPLRRSNIGFGGCFHDRSLIDGSFDEHVIQPLRESRRTQRAAISALLKFHPGVVDDLADVHRKISCPTQLIWGDRDPFFPLRKVDGMRSQFDGPTDLHVIPKGRLFVHEEFPAEYASVAGRALRKARAKAARLVAA